MKESIKVGILLLWDVQNWGTAILREAIILNIVTISLWQCILKYCENLILYFTRSLLVSCPPSPLHFVVRSESVPVGTPFTPLQFSFRNCDMQDNWITIFIPFPLSVFPCLLYQSANRNKVWKRREIKNMERNEVFSFQMFRRKYDTIDVTVSI